MISSRFYRLWIDAIASAAWHSGNAERQNPGFGIAAILGQVEKPPEASKEKP
jgi:hypothetical protein